jgi:hypothetical protein
MRNVMLAGPRDLNVELGFPNDPNDPYVDLKFSFTHSSDIDTKSPHLCEYTFTLYAKDSQLKETLVAGAFKITARLDSTGKMEHNTIFSIKNITRLNLGTQNSSYPSGLNYVGYLVFHRYGLESKPEKSSSITKKVKY